MGTFSNFAISFSIISILAGAITTYYLGMQAGGPLAITFSWVIVGVFATIIGAIDGGDLLDLSDRRWPVLLVGQAGRRPTRRRGRGSPGGST